MKKDIVTVVSFKKEAWFKMILHSCKYLNQSIGGLLIGTIEDNDSFNIVDCVPLFHTPILDPMLEFSLLQTEIWSQKKSLKIIGYYHANEKLKDVKLPPICYKIGNKIKINSEKAIILLLDNQNIGKKQFTSFLYQSSLNNEKQIEWAENSESNLFQFDESEEDEVIFKRLQNQIKNNLFHNLVDFDDHLSNPSFDWRNENLFN
eukprot:TRINITY_DN8711_c0_g1_i1.p1 TRINITY_DN8711_c0_g1~~TRINITY_DN8711_c0_g1_i1.p1  ORF type:complete len:204 (-),score=54.24 TRINITY_DN8711_c0_g1_i1:21-632(-)